MTVTLTILALLSLTFASVWLIDRARQVSNRSSRKNIRRIQRYLDQLPPARPW